MNGPKKNSPKAISCPAVIECMPFKASPCPLPFFGQGFIAPRDFPHFSNQFPLCPFPLKFPTVTAPPGAIMPKMDTAFKIVLKWSQGGISLLDGG